MDETLRFRQATADWVAGGVTAGVAARTARVLAAGSAVRTVVLVEGTSDAAAIDRLAVRRGRNLDAEGTCIVPLGGATSIGRFLALFVQQELDVKLAGLCDVGEEEYFRRALERAGFGLRLTPEDMTGLGFHVCVDDLEDWSSFALVESLDLDRVPEPLDRLLADI